jgi:class 3 adenylate cyclase
VLDAVRYAPDVGSQHGPPERWIEFRIGIHLGEIVEEADGTT